MQFKRKRGKPYKCNFCGSYKTIRKGTRPSGGILKRRLLCKDCGKRFSITSPEVTENESSG